MSLSAWPLPKLRRVYFVCDSKESKAFSKASNEAELLDSQISSQTKTPSTSTKATPEPRRRSLIPFTA